MLAERIDDRGVGVRDQEHVRLLDLLEPSDRRTVEPVAVLEAVFRQLMDRHREVLHDARKVTEAQIDKLDPAALGEIEDLFRRAALHWNSILRQLSVAGHGSLRTCAARGLVGARSEARRRRFRDRCSTVTGM